MMRAASLVLSLALIFESAGFEAYAAVAKARGSGDASIGRIVVGRLGMAPRLTPAARTAARLAGPAGASGAALPQAAVAALADEGFDPDAIAGRIEPEADRDPEISGIEEPSVVDSSRETSIDNLTRSTIKTIFSNRPAGSELAEAKSVLAAAGGTGAAAENDPAAKLAASPAQAPPAGLTPKSGENKPPAASPPQEGSSQEKSRSGKSVMWFLAGILTAQIGIEILGAAMPLLMRERFGGFSAMAQIAVFSAVAGIFGKLLGGPAAEKLGLKTTYVLSTALRLASVTAMILFLLGPGAMTAAATATGLGFLSTLGAFIAPFHQTPALMFKAVAMFYSVNSFMAGMSITAEDALPPRMLGNNRGVLEQFYALEHWLVEIIGVGGPKAGGLLIRHFGFVPALIVYPIVLTTALFMFIFGIKVPETAKTKPQEATPKGKSTETKPKRGIFALVFRNPILRTAFFSYIAFLVLNPILYQILGPAFGVHMSGGRKELAADVSTYITALYSLGGLFGALFMWRESKLINSANSGGLELAAENTGKFTGLKRFSSWLVRKLDPFILKAYLGKWLNSVRRPDGHITEDGIKQIQTKSTLLWMRLGTLTLVGFAALLLPIPYVAYLAMIPFGAAQVISVKKLRALAMSEVSEHEVVKLTAFMGASAGAVFALNLNLMGKLFDAFSGVAPFLYFDAAVAGLAALYFWLTYSLKRKISAPKPDAGENH